MGFLQKEFNQFHENIKLKDIDDNQQLRDKRDILVKELKDWGKENDKPTFSSRNQGSYDFGTGIKPLNNEDYDIDVAIIYDLDVEDYKDPVEVKKWVREALDNYGRTISIKTPCVRVQYHKAGELAYHVDFAVYGKAYNFWGNEKHLYLAKGKEFSTEEYRFWEEAGPMRLKEVLNGKFSNKEKRYQFKRCIRYLKRWKDYKFTDTGNARPTGIAMTACAYHWFVPEIEAWNGEKDLDDLSALTNLVKQICTHNHGLKVNLPVLPGNLLFETLRANQAHEESYINKMDKLLEALEKAKEEIDPHEASKILRKVFGDDFPLPPKGSNSRITGGPAIAPSTESA